MIYSNFKRGPLRGCFSSVYFFVIAEILDITLRDNDEIDQINIEAIKNLLNQFADDMDIFTICKILNELDKIYKQSGFQISYEKTTPYRKGPLQKSNAQM